MQQYFKDLSDGIFGQCGANEKILLNLTGETSDFVRINHAKVRQPGTVNQNVVELKLIVGKKQASLSYTLSGNLQQDRGALQSQLDSLRGATAEVPDDPYLLFAEEMQSSHFVKTKEIPETQQLVSDVLQLAADVDLVGIITNGSMYRGFANSMGQSNWFETHAFHCDWSMYLSDDKAVKKDFAGFKWDKEAFVPQWQSGLEQLEHMKKSPVTIKPGKYRVYLAPAAMQELFSLLNWGSFGLNPIRTKQSPLRKWVEGAASLSPMVSFRDDFKLGTVAGFSDVGFTRPDSVEICQAGQFANAVVSPRSAKEFAVETTGAEQGESILALSMDGGDIASADIVEKLEDGIYINNLWYCNYSDRNQCRITGMTRFASFWVEKGQIVGPLNVMRFDESMYNILGKNLVGLTQECEMALNNMTYGHRQTGSTRLPGALVNDFAFTL